jgi:hypothetical protein
VSSQQPKCPCVKTLVPKEALLGSCENSKWWGLVKEFMIIGDGLWGVADSCSFLFFFFASWLMIRWVVLLCHVLPLQCAVLSHTQKSNGASWSWAETSKTMSPHKPFLFTKWLSQAFVTVMESWLTSYNYVWRVQYPLSVAAWACRHNEYHETLEHWHPVSPASKQ